MSYRFGLLWVDYVGLYRKEPIPKAEGAAQEHPSSLIWAPPLRFVLVRRWLQCTFAQKEDKNGCWDFVSHAAVTSCRLLPAAFMSGGGETQDANQQQQEKLLVQESDWDQGESHWDQ